MRNIDHYDMTVDIRITQVDEHGSHPYGEGLSVRENQRITASTFLQVAKILGRFDELIRTIRQEQTEPSPYEGDSPPPNPGISGLVWRAGSDQ